MMMVSEIIVLPSRDRARLILMNGTTLECAISDIKYANERNGKVTIITKRADGKTFRVMIDRITKRRIKPEYINTELLMAIVHPDVHRI